MKMIPNYLPINVRSGAERRLFADLDNIKEGEGYYCLHSLSLPEHEYKVLGELDFVIVSSKGIYVIEVKGGGISCRDGIWYFEDRRGNFHHSSEGPFQQARSGMYSLRNQLLKRLSEFELNKLVMGYGVAFPDCNFDIEGLEWDKELILDATSNSKDGIEKYLTNLEKYWHKKFDQRRENGSQNTVLDIVRIMRPSFDLAKSLQVQAEEIESRMISLTDEQYSRLDIIEHYERILIEGGAGTGKTLLAINEAKKQAYKNKKVLLVCFSPVLANFLNKRSDDSKVTILSIHSLMQSTVKKYGKIPPGYAPGMPITDKWFRNKLTHEFEKASIYLQDDDLYDVLIIDEGQDILNLDYMAALDRMLMGGFAEGVWRIFYDPFNQGAIFGVMDTEILDLLKSYSPIIPRLTINCRNTDPIMLHTKLFTGADMANKSTGSGPIVDVVFYESQKAGGEILEAFLKQLINEQGVKEKEITILSPTTFEHSAANLLRPKWRNRIRVLEGSREDVFPFPGITFATIADFKGLENSFIALIDIENMDNSSEVKATLYVGMTRARVKLWVAINKSQMSNHNHIIEENYKTIIKRRGNE